jgi:hypothetical protein
MQQIQSSNTCKKEMGMGVQSRSSGDSHIEIPLGSLSTSVRALDNASTLTKNGTVELKRRDMRISKKSGNHEMH